MSFQPPTPRAAVLLFVLAGAALPSPVPAAELDGPGLLASALRHHDPNGVWPEVCLELELRETRPGGDDRRTLLILDPGSDRFEIIRKTGDGPETRGVATASECRWELDGSDEISQALREEHRLDCGRLETLRDYYTYLWGLPMKLEDPGTRVDPEVRRGAFDDRPADVLRVTYEPGVGEEVWLFYFEPERHALIGARFFHDEAAGDGEAIVMGPSVLEPETGLVIPAERSWFTNRGGELLGSDVLENLDACR